jgi:hypothetical protein
MKTHKEIIDEVARFKEFCAEFGYELDDERMLQEIFSKEGEAVQ